MHTIEIYNKIKDKLVSSIFNAPYVIRLFVGEDNIVCLS